MADESNLHYLPTSPTLDAQSGDEHAWGVWFGLEDFDTSDRHGGRFASSMDSRFAQALNEAGITSWRTKPCSSVSAASGLAGAGIRWMGHDASLHVQNHRGTSEGDLDDWIFKSQWTQAEVRQHSSGIEPAWSICGFALLVAE